MVTLIVETGAGVANANAYDTLENVTSYISLHGYVDWPDLSPEDEDAKTAIVRATAWLDNRYRTRYPGRKVGGRSQSLGFPVEDADYVGVATTDIDGNEIAIDEVPIEIKRAMAEAAYREYITPGSLQPDYTQLERTKQETLGPLTVVYADPVAGPKDALPVMTIIDQILEPLLGAPVSLLFGTTTRI